MISTPSARHALSILPSRNPRLAWSVIADGAHRAMRTFNFFNVSDHFPALADLVEDIVDWDIPDASIARSLSVMVLPTTAPHLVVQYRTPVASSRKFGDATVAHRPYQHVVSTVRSGVAMVQPRGPLGLIVVRLRPEAAGRLLGDDIYEFADTKVDLDAVFGVGVVASLVDML